jgi:membrane-associated protease RseP (regulator of RpoE activity)
VRPPRDRPWLNLLLLLATAATTLWIGFGLDPSARDLPVTAGAVLRHGWPYAASLILILGAHEMGHYLMARRHRVDATLPFFIPVPLGAGTFGAFIRIRSLLPSRRVVLDVGLAGPWAGFAVALPLLLVGLSRSTLVDAAALGTSGLDAPLDLLLAWWRGEAVPPPAGLVLLGDSLVTWGAQRLVWGALPAGKDLLLDPVAYAAWIGMLITALNLFPIGQLDGGHALYALFGQERAHRLSRLVSAGLLLAGLLVSFSWLAWWVVSRIAARPHPRALDERPLDPGRRLVALLSLLLLLGTLIPVPVSA